MVFYTLDVFLSWLKDVVKGKTIQEPYKYPVWLDILTKNINEAEEAVQSVRESINDYVYNPTNSKKEVRKYLRNEFENQISKYNKIVDKNFFYLLRDENRNALVSDFKIDAFFNNNQEKYLKELKETYILQNISWDISFTYNEIFKTRTIYYKDDASSHLTIHSLMNKMVLDKELSIELSESMDDFFKEMNNTSLPLDIHFYNHREKYIKLFEKSILRMQSILDDAEPNKKVLYIQSRLKELRHRESMFNSLIDRNKDFKDKEDKYQDLFKEFLSIEAEFIKETIQISPIAFLPNPVKPLLIKKDDSFETFVNKEKQDYILKLLEDLSITNNGVSIVSQRKKSVIRGVVEALRDACIFPNKDLHSLCLIIGEQIGLEIKSKLEKNYTSDESKKSVKQYMKNNPFH